MKTIYLSILLLVLSLNAFSQEFSYEMYFEDALGNRDTLILGYDVLGTDSIDALFNETNIISLSLDSVFDVRVTDEFFTNWGWTGDTVSYHTKKQIAHYDCDSPLNWDYPLISIDIKAIHWPVTASWDNSLFMDTCRNGSVFTSINPGGWWDTGSPSDLDMFPLEQENQVTFTSQTSGFAAGNINDNYAYLNDFNDTISYFWVSFGDLNLMYVGIDEKEQEHFKMYPNPASTYIIIESLGSDDTAEEIKLYDMWGRKLEVIIENKTIDISHLPDGVYVIDILSKNQRFQRERFIKVSD